jgi:hypothetical protein
MFKYKITWKSVQWEPSSSMRTGGRTDMTKLIVAFLIFVQAPKSQYFYQKGKMLQLTSFRPTHRFWTLQETNTYARPNIKEIVSLYEIVGCNLTLNKCSLISPSKSHPAQLQDNGSKQHINHRTAFQSTSTFQWEIIFFSFAVYLCSWYFQRKQIREV